MTGMFLTLSSYANRRLCLFCLSPEPIINRPTDVSCFYPSDAVYISMAYQMTKKWCETDSKALDLKEYYQERRLKELQLDLPYEASRSRSLYQ